MPQYRCPECKAVLKKEQAIDPGKKIRCPKCEAVFAAKPLAEKEATKPEKEKAKPEKKKPEPAKTAPAEPKAFDDDDEEGGVYLTTAEKKDEDEEPKEEINYGSLRDKYFKSKKGPAMALTVRPSNYLVMWGILLGVFGVFLIGYAAWPFIFNADKTLSKNEKSYQILVGAMGIVFMIVASLVCWGASKLQSLESYALAWMGAVLGLPIGIIAIIVLSKPEVKAGFDEVAEAEVM